MSRAPGLVILPRPTGTGSTLSTSPWDTWDAPITTDLYDKG